MRTAALRSCRLALAAAIFASCAGARPPDFREARGAIAVPGGSHLAFEAKGAGRAVVFIHGGNLDRRLWDAEFERCSREFLAVRYDVRGFGASGPTDLPYSSHEDLLALLDALEIERAALVGVSLGGRIAIDFALTHAERVDALVLAGPGLSGFPWSKEGLAELTPMLAAARAGDGERAAELWLETAYARPAMEDPALAARLRDLARSNARAFVARDAEEGCEPPAYGRVHELRVPTLLLVGARDVPDIQAIAAHLALQIPGARRIDFPGAGHFLNLERPAEFERALLEFLGGLP